MQHRVSSKARKSRRRSTDKMVSPARSIEGSLRRALGESHAEEATDPSFVMPPVEPEIAVVPEEREERTMPLVRLGEND